MAEKRIVLIGSATNLVVPAGVTLFKKVEVFGQGGDRVTNSERGGTGGGEYRYRNNVAVTPGASIPVSINGGTWFQSTGFLIANGGQPASGVTGGAGGSGGIGDGGYDGGAGGTGSITGSAGGGGCAGPNGAGAKGGDATIAGSAAGGGGGDGGTSGANAIAALATAGGAGRLATGAGAAGNSAAASPGTSGGGGGAGQGSYGSGRGATQAAGATSFCEQMYLAVDQSGNQQYYGPGGGTGGSATGIPGQAANNNILNGLVYRSVGSGIGGSGTGGGLGGQGMIVITYDEPATAHPFNYALIIG